MSSRVLVAFSTSASQRPSRDQAVTFWSTLARNSCSGAPLPSVARRKTLRGVVRSELNTKKRAVGTRDGTMIRAFMREPGERPGRQVEMPEIVRGASISMITLRSSGRSAGVKVSADRNGERRLETVPINPHECALRLGGAGGQIDERAIARQIEKALQSLRLDTNGRPGEEGCPGHP